MKYIREAMEASAPTTGDIVKELAAALGKVIDGAPAIELSEEASRRVEAAGRIIYELRHRSGGRLSLRIAIAMVLAQGHQVIRRPARRERVILGPCKRCMAPRGKPCTAPSGRRCKPHSGRIPTGGLGLGALIQSDPPVVVSGGGR